MPKIYRIHPAIGIARVGNADRPPNNDAGYFVGPELPGVAATPSGLGFKDAQGRVRAQAAKFRIFEYDQDATGKIGLGREVKLGDGRTTAISWTVELANKKASFFNFSGQVGASDLHASRPVTQRRNRLVKDGDFSPPALAERSRLLDLVPGPRTISGKNSGGQEFSVSRPPLAIKTLGELRTDGEGALIVIGGKGIADRDPGLPWSHPGPQGPIQDFANTDQWFDDVSDGPVTASIMIDGAAQKVQGSWVLVGPPDFGPAIHSYRTMYDTLIDVIVREIPLPNEAVFAGALKHLADMKADYNATTQRFVNFKPSFTRDIAPILAPMFKLSRVFDRRASPTGLPPNFHSIMNDFSSLGAAGSDPQSRQDIFVRLRNPKSVLAPPVGAVPDLTKMPNVYGDHYLDGVTNPGFAHCVSQLQYALLERWKSGQFVEDWTGPLAAPVLITPEGLDQAALENAIGGAFVPGIEASWMIERAVMFKAPLRIDENKVITATSTVGALELKAGFFSRQMALPWQADFLDCSKGGTPTGRQYAWWPVQRPDNIVADFDTTKGRIWARKADGTPFNAFDDMINSWWTLGFVVDKNNDLFETDGPIPPPPPTV
jgi:L-Lysine epsilon oxidase N-terminal/L-lysine epsilon oxidase C-terminal domain